MKKFGIIVGSLMLALFGAASVSASGDSPWNQVWTAIQELRTQIDDIPEGPAGPEGSQGPQGEPGPVGPEGPAGPALSGINKDAIYVVRSAYMIVTPGLATFARARCDDNNDPLLSGGYHMSPPQFSHITVVGNAGMPTDSIAGWTVAAITDADHDLGAGAIQAEAYCLRVD